MAQRRELSARERIFVREYLVDLNATQAAIRAGYSRRSASRNTHEVFYRPHVKAAIEAALAKRAAKLEITAERVLREATLHAGGEGGGRSAEERRTELTQAIHDARAAGDSARARELDAERRALTGRIYG